LSNKLNLPVIFITNDVKDDWCNVEKRSNETRILSPKDDLIFEFKHKTKKQFWMYSFSQFLYKAKEILNSEITNEALEEVKNINIDVAKNNKLKFNCIYRSKRMTTADKTMFYRRFLRFFEDGTVVGVSATAEGNEISSWFNHNYEDRGVYSIKNNEIHFKLTSPSGSVEYNGKIEDGFIYMHEKSLINGNESDRRYSPIEPI